MIFPRPLLVRGKRRAKHSPRVYFDPDYRQRQAQQSRSRSCKSFGHGGDNCHSNPLARCLIHLLAAQMKIKPPGLTYGAVGAVILIAAIWLFHSNDLGLTGFDVLMGGRSELEELRTNTKVAADFFLAQHKTLLVGESDKKSELALDYSQTSKIRSLGYRSSFYYYCWDVYLPYSLRMNSRDMGTVIVQLSDATPNHHHDPKKFCVIRAGQPPLVGQSGMLVSGDRLWV